MYKIFTILLFILLLVSTASAISNDGELVQINSTHWYFKTAQTDLAYGEYDYQAYANNISSDYRTLEYALSYSMSGYIVSNGAVISGANVSNNQTAGTTTTNVSGYYILDSIQNGSVLVTATATGYTTNSTTITVNGTNLTNINLTLTAQLITVTNLTVSPITIKEGQTSTITVDANETSGSITSVTATIGGSTYLMSATTGDTWSYTWTAPQNAPHKYYITQIAATGQYSTNTTTQTAYIDVLSSTGTGGGGGGGFPTPDISESETVESPTVQDVIEESTSLLNSTISTITNTTERVKNIIMAKEIAITGVKFMVGDYSTTKEFAKPDALTCESTDPRVSCGVMNGVLTIIIIPTTDDSKIYQLTDTNVKITNNDGNMYHLPVSLSLLNLMWYFDFNIDTGIQNPYIVAGGANTGTTIGLRGWWITIVLGLFVAGFAKKYG